VTEAEWLQCCDIPTLLDYLVDRVSCRKFRLFGVACCRRIWPLLVDTRARNAVCLSKRFADGLATEEQVEIARREMIDLRAETALRPGSDVLSWAYLSWAYGAAEQSLFETPTWGPGVPSKWTAGVAYAAAEAAWRVGTAGPAGAEQERVQQLALLRDVFENPYRPDPIDPAWVRSEALSIATRQYESADFSKMRELAEALDAAGCSDEAVLDHCRQAGPHVRGCWVVDGVLGTS
jgi:hypothetical protein